MLAHIVPDLIAQVAHNEDHFLQLRKRDHWIQEVTQHSLPCDGNQGLRFRPGMGAKPRSKPRHREDQSHNSGHLVCQDAPA